MSSFSCERQESLKRMWQIDERLKRSSALYKVASNPTTKTGLSFSGEEMVIPAVTVVLEGRSICQRISLQKHGSYNSLARALKHMFVDQDYSSSDEREVDVDLSNVIPGHIIAYEDIENDLLLVGDLNWKDFVRVAKRIRILPVKEKSRKLKREGSGVHELM